MNLKAATLIVIIGLSISFLMLVMATTPFLENMIADITIAEIAPIFYPVMWSFLCLPLINFFIALFIKQK
jgi:hypothetical protein